MPEGQIVTNIKIREPRSAVWWNEKKLILTKVCEWKYCWFMLNLEVYFQWQCYSPSCCGTPCTSLRKVACSIWDIHMSNRSLYHYVTVRVRVVCGGCRHSMWWIVLVYKLVVLLFSVCTAVQFAFHDLFTAVFFWDYLMWNSLFFWFPYHSL